ncbi:MAG: sialate O-acetylesterase [Flavobacteriaceae bacterium]|nr:MAG: sialate O-acetylesterase [Flavobacteriaceae bacterium]
MKNTFITMKKTIFFLFLFSSIIGSAQKKYSSHYYKLKEVYENTPNTEDEIIFLGNSITEGGNWAQMFPNVNAINRGISGDVSDGILNRLDEITASKPKKVFLMIGTNDLAHGKTEEYILTNTELILSRIKTASPNTRIYLQEVLPYNPTVGKKFSGHKSNQQRVIILNKRLKKLARKNKVKIINTHKKFRNRKGLLIREFTYDGLHLNAKGYKHWSKVLRKYVHQK